MCKLVRPFVDRVDEHSPHKATVNELFTMDIDPLGPIENFRLFNDDAQTHWTFEGMAGAVDFHDNRLKAFAAQSQGLIAQVDRACKAASHTIDVCEKVLGAKDATDWNVREIQKARKATEAARQQMVERLKRIRYFQRQAAWLIERFPKAEMQDVPGLCKVVTRAEIEAADWSLTPGRFVGVAPAEVDDDFDFEQTIRDIHVELADLNREAGELSAKIQANFEGFGV
jgi:type I restriction enzyme M protein